MSRFVHGRHRIAWLFGTCPLAGLCTKSDALSLCEVTMRCNACCRVPVVNRHCGYGFCAQGSGSSNEGLEDRVIATSPLLEAFGNAQVRSSCDWHVLHWFLILLMRPLAASLTSV